VSNVNWRVDLQIAASKNSERMDEPSAIVSIDLSRKSNVGCAFHFGDFF
jgi:hypothetical protein